MTLFVVIITFAVALALIYAAVNYFLVKKLKEGTDEMSEIASAIRIGASSFIKYEYKVLAGITAIIALLIFVFLSWTSGVAFLLGITLSGSAGWIGMKIATYANVRVTNAARLTKNIGETLKVAYRGGSVMGICVSSFALLGLLIVFLIFGWQLDIMGSVPNWIGLEFIPFSMTLSSYALGCSTIAMFNRVGGGIYTKAADMGADLVGKTELNIPEDDPRNPATIADNVGDNVGDVAGLGSDLLESYVGAIVSAIILSISLFVASQAQNLGMTYEMLKASYLYPIIFAGLGLISCMIGIGFTLCKKPSNNPHRELNLSTWFSAGITLISTFFLTKYIFGSVTLLDEFKFGAISPWLSALMGVGSGIIIGIITEYYTSYDYKPTQKIAGASKEGAALTITQGLSVGMNSCLIPVVVLGLALLGAYYFSGIYGVAMAAVGMLSFVSTTVSVDTYGPIADNAGGIAEMSELEPEVREITDKLDSVGNTTAAIGKGFAIGSAAFATLSLMVSYMYSFTPATETLLLNLLDPLVLAGILVGGALPFFFSGILINAVAIAARCMVEEVRRQFREIAGLMEGITKPDYKACVEISSKGALAEMKKPALLAVIFPVLSGFLFGAQFVGGVLLGATISAIMLAIFCGNSGGAWDNAKKYIESGGIEGEKKGSTSHVAAVVGDTVGDPLKDTVGPSLDILIKIMSVVSLIAVAVYNNFNLLELIKNIF